MEGKPVKSVSIICCSDNERVQYIASDSSLKQRPYAVIECFEEIPCNPCQTCCPQNAISFDESITSIPKLDIEKCTGCGICIPACPGLAIFVIDEGYSKTEGLVSIPYEFLPLPKEGQIVDVTNRKGEAIGKGHIFKVRNSKKFDCTAVVTIKISKSLLMEVRGIQLVEGDEQYER